MFSTMLEKLREKSGLTQKELAAKLGIARTTYSGYATGTREPDLMTLKKISDYFDVSVDYLLGKTTQKDAAEELIEYLDVLELTDEEIYDRMTFKVDNMTLSKEEVMEFISFVRYQRSKKKQQPASASKHEEL